MRARALVLVAFLGAALSASAQWEKTVDGWQKVTSGITAADGLDSVTCTPPLACALAAKAFTGSVAITPTNPGGAVALQVASPGVAQTGSDNLTGTRKGATLQAGYSTITGLVPGTTQIGYSGGGYSNAAAGNFTAQALAQPVITGVTPTLTKVGSITTVATADLVDGDYFTLDDGSAYLFEYDLAADGVTAGRTAITLAGGEDADAVRDLTITAIGTTAIGITATSGGAATVTLTRTGAPGLPAGTNTENVGAAGFGITGMADPTHVTTYTYAVVALMGDDIAYHSQGSAAVSTATGHATLSASNYNHVVVGAVTGASGYLWYRTVGGATQGLIATTAASVVSIDDTGLAGNGATPATTNTTGTATAAKYSGPTNTSATYVIAASNSRDTSKADYVCTGTADEVLIQSVIDALPATGGRVLLLDGLYSTTATIYTHYGLTLEGQGRSTIIKAASGTGRDMITVYNRTSVKGNTAGNYVTIKNLTLDGNGLSGITPIHTWGYDGVVLNPRVLNCTIKNATGTSYGILTMVTTDLLVDGNTIDSFSDSVIELRSTRRAVISNNHLSSGSLQFYAGASGGVTAGEIVVTGNVLNHVSITVDADATVLDGLQIVGNDWRSTGYTWTVNSTKNLSVVGNVIDGSAGTAPSGPMMYLYSTVTDYVVADNIIKVPYNTTTGLGYGAIRSDGARGLITGNRFVIPNDSNYGFRTVSATAGPFTISNNTFEGTNITNANARGVDLANATGVTIWGNRFHDLGKGIVTDAATTGTRVSSNRYTSVAVPHAILGDVSGPISKTWTNAEITALGAVLNGDIKIATLSPKVRVKNAYIVVGTAATGTGVDTLTLAVGRTGATYLDYLGNADIMAAANTLYGGAAGERGANLTGYDLPSVTANTDVYAHVIMTSGSGKTLADVLTSTGTIYLDTEALP